MNGMHHPNYAIMALEKELNTHIESLKGWSEESKIEYSEAWKRAHKEIKELEQAIQKLKS